jgi:hypothetical protein
MVLLLPHYYVSLPAVPIAYVLGCSSDCCVGTGLVMTITVTVSTHQARNIILLVHKLKERKNSGLYVTA